MVSESSVRFDILLNTKFSRSAGRGWFLSHTETVLWGWRLNADLPEMQYLYVILQAQICQCMWPVTSRYTLCVYRMAEKYNMKLLFKAPFADYFQQKIHNSENRGLIGRMQGLEVKL